MYVNINTPHVETLTKRSVSTHKPMLHVTRISVNSYLPVSYKILLPHHLLSASVLMCVFTVIRGLPQYFTALWEFSYSGHFT
jgi:hypothetical protein